MKHENARSSGSGGTAAPQSAEDVDSALDMVLTTAPVQRKRTRDELLAELKNSRKRGEHDEENTDAIARLEREKLNEEKQKDGFEMAKAAGKFKSINKVAEDKAKTAKQLVGPDGKVRRKKKKVQDLPTAVQAAPKPKVVNTIDVTDVDGDDDIFGGAVEYKGLGSDSDDDDSSKPPPLAATAVNPAALVKRSYFDEAEDDESGEARAVGAPASIAKIADAARAAPQLSRSSGDGDGEILGPGMRLQGLSGGSSVDARTLLDFDAAADVADKRREVCPPLYTSIRQSGC